MTQTAVGVVCDGLGLAQTERRSWSTPAAAVAEIQDDRIPIDYHHDGRRLGEVVHLERDKAGRLWAVGELEEPVAPFVPVTIREGETVLVPQPLYWSATRIGGEEDGILFTSLAVTPYPAQTSARPLELFDGALDWRGAERRWNLRAGFERDLLHRASETRYQRRCRPGSAIRVRDHYEPTIVRVRGDNGADAWLADGELVPTSGRLEIRPAGRIVRVH
jgi:hypothetical protein